MALADQVNQIITSQTPASDKAVALCELVREIPYSVTPSYDPQDLLYNGAGSCTPKHILLASYLQKIDVPTRFLIAPFHYYKSEIAFPKTSMPIIRAMPLTYHTALKVKLHQQYITIDATWDSRLQGFPNNSDWDHVSDMRLAVIPEEIIETTIDPREFTRPLKSTYTARDWNAIENFVAFFNGFCADARK